MSQLVEDEGEPLTHPTRPTGMDKQRLTLTALTLLPLVVACGSEKAGSGSVGSGSGSSEPTVTGIHWTVDSLTVDGKKSAQAPDGAYLKIAEDGKVNGNYGCNGFGATATVDGGIITFRDAQSTDIACVDVPMSFEESLRRTLSDGKLKAEAGDGKLTLTSDAGDKVVLREEKAAPLYGTTWEVASLVGKNAAQPLPSEAAGKAWFTIDEKNGKLTGSLGCNRVTADATVRDGRITLGAPATTRRMCDGSLMDTERTLLELFKSDVEYKIDHRTITLTSENGEGINAVAKK